jgi:hypothetical protein
MLLISFAIISPLICLLLLFWHKTNFFTIYGKIFGLTKFLKIDLYEEKKLRNLDLTYPLFLATSYTGFFIRLISCVVCLTTWLSIIFSFIFYLIFLDIYILLLIPLNTLLGLVFYLKIKKLI